MAALLKKDPSLLKVCICVLGSRYLPCQHSFSGLYIYSYSTHKRDMVCILQELNTKGKTAADLVSHKKKLREWFEVRPALKLNPGMRNCCITQGGAPAANCHLSRVVMLAPATIWL